MTVREYVGQIKVLELKIAHRRKQIAELKEKAKAMGALSVKDDPVQTSKTGSLLEEKVTEYVDLERRVDELLIVLEAKKDKIISEIHRLDDQRYIDVLYKRYVEGMKLSTVARKMSYSYGRTKHLIREAEAAFAKVSTF